MIEPQPGNAATSTDILRSPITGSAERLKALMLGYFRLTAVALLSIAAGSDAVDANSTALNFQPLDTAMVLRIGQYSSIAKTGKAHAFVYSTNRRFIVLRLSSDKACIDPDGGCVRDDSCPGIGGQCFFEIADMKRQSILVKFLAESPVELMVGGGDRIGRTHLPFSVQN